MSLLGSQEAWRKSPTTRTVSGYHPEGISSSLSCTHEPYFLSSSLPVSSIVFSSCFWSSAWILQICTDNCHEVLFVFLCVHVSKYVRYVYMHVDIHVCSSVQVCGYICVHAQNCVYACLCMHGCIGVCMYTCTFTNSVYMCEYECAFIWVYIHFYTWIQLYVWACMCTHECGDQRSTLCVISLVLSTSFMNSSIRWGWITLGLLALQLWNYTITDSFVDSGNPMLVLMLSQQALHPCQLSYSDSPESETLTDSFEGSLPFLSSSFFPPASFPPWNCQLEWEKPAWYYEALKCGSEPASSRKLIL